MMFAKPNLAFPLCHEETATSYVSRLSIYAKAPTPYDLCSDLGLEWPTVVSGDETQLRALAALGGADVDDLLRWSIKSLGGLIFRIGNDEVPNKTLLRSRVRLCPKCIVEDGDRSYRRFHWNLRSIRVCSEHRVPLIQLQHLEHTIGNYDFAQRVIACRAQIEEAAARSEGLRFTEYENYLLGRLRGETSSFTFLASLSLSTLTRMTESLGLTLLECRDRLSEVPEAVMHAAGDAGFAYIKHGEKGLRDALQDLQIDPLQSNASHKIDYGAFWVWLRTATTVPDVERIRDIAREFVFANYPIQRGTEILGKKCPKTQIYSINSAKMEHGVSRKRLVRCLIEVGAALPAPNNPEGLTLLRQVTAADIDQITTHRANFVHRKEASAMLGSSDKAFRQLRLRGVINQYADVVDKRPMFNPTEIEAYLASLSPSIDTACKAPKGHLRLPAACQRLGTALIGAVDLILAQKVISARLVPDGAGLDRIFVNPEDLRDAILADMTPALPKLKAAEFLATSLRTVDHLIKTKQLELIKRGRSLKGYDFPAVSRTSITSFLEDFTTVGRLARSMGLNFMYVMHGLEKSGVTSVAVPKGIGRYYEREHLKSRRRLLTFDLPKKIDWDLA